MDGIEAHLLEVREHRFRACTGEGTSVPSSYTKKGSSNNPMVYVRNVKTGKKVGPVTQAQADELIRTGQSEAL